MADPARIHANKLDRERDGLATSIEDLLPYLMNRLLVQLNRNLTERLRATGYSFQDWRIVAILVTHDGASINQLAEAAVLPQPTASRLAAQLDSAGLIERRSDDGDQRRVSVYLTAKGRAAYADMLPHAVAEYEAAMSGFSVSERAFLFKAIERMAGNIGMRFWPPGEGA